MFIVMVDSWIECGGVIPKVIRDSDVMMSCVYPTHVRVFGDVGDIKKQDIENFIKKDFCMSDESYNTLLNEREVFIENGNTKWCVGIYETFQDEK